MDVDPRLAGMLEVIAEGVIEFAGFALAAVSLISDEILHTVAVVGDDDAVARLMDLQAPVDLVRSELAAADSWGALRFLPAERAAGQLERHHWVPAIAPLPVDDAWDPMDLLCGLLRDGNGRLRGLLSVDLPINGRRPDQAQRETLQMYVRLAERALITALERGGLEEKVEEEQALAEYRRGIIDVLTHELRGSVGAIANTVVYLRGRPEWTDLDGVESALRIVEGGAQRIRSVVENMSALTELGKTDIRLRTELCDLGRIARDAVELHAVFADLQHIDLRCDVVGDAIVLGDPNDLDRMVGNLVSNAVKYSDQGGASRSASRAATTPLSQRRS